MAEPGAMTASGATADLRADPHFGPGLKLGVESMTRCLGTCSGCMLSQAERRAEAAWDPAIMAGVRRFTRALIAGIEARFGRCGLRDLFFLCGQGDHALMAEAAIPDFVDWIAAATGGLASAEISASLINRPERARAAIEAFHAASLRARQPLLVNVVFDPDKARHPHFRDSYLGNIQHAREVFGLVDLGANLGPDIVAGYSPREFHDFVRRGGFSHLEFNLVPTGATAAAFAACWESLMSWLRRYYALWLAEPAYDLGFGYMLAHHMAEADGLALAPLRRRLAGHFLRELYIDHRGDLYFAQNGGFGALVPLTARLGFPVIGNVRDDAPETLIARLESRAWEMATRLAARYLRDRACARCPHLGGCASAGPAALRATMEPVLDGGAEAGSAAGSRDEACPIGLRPLLADIAAARAAGRAPTRSRIPGEALQAGLEGHRFAPARIQPLDERQGELRI